jgi:hypothetical protein
MQQHRTTTPALSKDLAQDMQVISLKRLEFAHPVMHDLYAAFGEKHHPQRLPTRTFQSSQLSAQAIPLRGSDKFPFSATHMCKPHTLTVLAGHDLPSVAAWQDLAFSPRKYALSCSPSLRHTHTVAHMTIRSHTSYKPNQSTYLAEVELCSLSCGF